MSRARPALGPGASVGDRRFLQIHFPAASPTSDLRCHSAFRHPSRHSQVPRDRERGSAGCQVTGSPAPPGTWVNARSSTVPCGYCRTHSRPLGVDCP